MEYKRDLSVYRKMYKAMAIEYKEKAIEHKDEDFNQKALNVYKNMLQVAIAENQKWIKEDMEKIKQYNFGIAWAKALENERLESFGYEYYFEKALRLIKGCSDTYKQVDKVRKMVSEKDKSKLELIKKQKERYSRLNKEIIARINGSRHYKLIQTTLAMEGNSFTLDEVERFLKTGQTIEHRSDIEHQEVKDAESAFKYSEEIIKRAGPITLDDIVGIHKKMLIGTKPKFAGRIRVDEKVFVGSNYAPPPKLLPNKMKKLIQNLNDRKRLDNIEVAANAHFELSNIHPFCDGNGRTSRLLMNIILQKSGYPPIDIPMCRRDDYYSSLRMGDDKYGKAYKRLIAECMESTLDEYLNERR